MIQRKEHQKGKSEKHLLCLRHISLTLRILSNLYVQKHDENENKSTQPDSLSRVSKWSCGKSQMSMMLKAQIRCRLAASVFKYPRESEICTVLIVLT